MNTKRNHNRNTLRRQAASKRIDESLYNTLSEVICGESAVTPHCLWHISCREWNEIKQYSIHATGLLAGEVAVYNNVTLGNKVKAPMKTSTSHGNTMRYKELNLSEMSGGYAYITTTIADIQSMIDSKSIILINSTEGCSEAKTLN